MVTKVRTLVREEPKTRPHTHFWLIESARGPMSRGVCKYCGLTREFQNSWYNMEPVKRQPVVKEPTEELEPEELEIEAMKEVELEEEDTGAAV